LRETKGGIVRRPRVTMRKVSGKEPPQKKKRNLAKTKGGGLPKKKGKGRASGGRKEGGWASWPGGRLTLPTLKKVIEGPEALAGTRTKLFQRGGKNEKQLGSREG